MIDKKDSLLLNPKRAGKKERFPALDLNETAFSGG